jgi:hypothetical protein
VFRLCSPGVCCTSRKARMRTPYLSGGHCRHPFKFENASFRNRRSLRFEVHEGRALPFKSTRLGWQLDLRALSAGYKTSTCALVTHPGGRIFRIVVTKFTPINKVPMPEICKYLTRIRTASDRGRVTRRPSRRSPPNRADRRARLRLLDTIESWWPQIPTNEREPEPVPSGDSKFG